MTFKNEILKVGVGESAIFDFPKDFDHISKKLDGSDGRLLLQTISQELWIFAFKLFVDFYDFVYYILIYLGIWLQWFAA